MCFPRQNAFLAEQKWFEQKKIVAQGKWFQVAAVATGTGLCFFFLCSNHEIEN